MFGLKADNRLAADAAIFAIIFFLHLAVQSSLCGDYFCGTDSYAYLLSVRDSNPFLFPGMPVGLSVFIPMLVLKQFFGPVLAIRLSSSLITALFFLVFSRLLQKIYGGWAFSRVFALAPLACFWWLRISFDVYKNEAAMLFLPLAWLFALEYLEKRSGKNLLLFLAFSALLLSSHFSTSFYLVESVLILGILSSAAKKQPIIVILALALLFLTIAYLASAYFNSFPETSDSDYLSNGSFEFAFYAVAFAFSLPLLLMGIAHLFPNNKASALFISSMVVASFALGFASAMPMNWAYRFFLDGFFAIFVALPGAFLFVKTAISEKKPLRARLLGYMWAAFLCSWLILALFSGIWQYKQFGEIFSQKDFSSLSAFLSEKKPSLLYVRDYFLGYDYALKLEGFYQIAHGRCPPNPPANSFEVVPSIVWEKEKAAHPEKAYYPVGIASMVSCRVQSTD